MLEFVDLFFPLVVAGYESSDRMSESLFHTLFVSFNYAMLWQLSSNFFRPHLTKDILFYLLKFVITTNHLFNKT